MLYSLYMLVVIRCKHIRRVLAYIGKNSVWIVCLHLLAFRIVACIQINYYDLPIDYINIAFRPVAEPYWWIAYTIVGVGVTLACKICFKYIKMDLRAG